MVIHYLLCGDHMTDGVMIKVTLIDCLSKALVWGVSDNIFCAAGEVLLLQQRVVICCIDKDATTAGYWLV